MAMDLTLVFAPNARGRTRDRWPPDDRELEVFTPDTRRRILSTTGTPFRYICKTQVDPSFGNCTGTIIAANKVLTVAHCVESLDAADIEVIPAKRKAGTDRNSEPFGRIGVTRIDFNAGFTGCGDLDYAVLTLSKSVATQIGTWSRLRAIDPAKILQIKKMNLAGFPRDLHPLGDEMYSTYNDVVGAAGATLEYEHDTFEGMSGGPIWIRWQNTRTIIGIHQCADQPGPPVGNRGLLFTEGILADISGWVRT